MCCSDELRWLFNNRLSATREIKVIENGIVIVCNFSKLLFLNDKAYNYEKRSYLPKLYKIAQLFCISLFRREKSVSGENTFFTRSQP